MNAISLFSSVGIGDLGLQANNIKTVISSELLLERTELFSHNYPDTKVFLGDIWDSKDDIISYYKEKFTEPPFLILATPPCQGMSSNGMGKMLNDFRKGLRPKMDERNRLIIPALDIIKELNPKWVILENVANMTNTLILDKQGHLVNIIEYIFTTLGEQYVGKAEVIDTADYGLPQHRKRLLTILSRSTSGKAYFEKKQHFIPAATHSQYGDLNTMSWVTLRDAIGNLPKLRAVKGKAVNKEFNELHKVPILDEKKLFWIDNTLEGETAFNNQCINPACLYDKNARHGASHDKDGINKANHTTPLYCEKCGELLPRPWVEDKVTGNKRLMKGFVSAYKRMVWDEPASTLTQNFQFACSDNKLHPEQSRVLSLYEGLVLQGIADYKYDFYINGKLVSDTRIRDAIGESVPPKIIDLIVKKIIEIETL